MMNSMLASIWVPSAQDLRLFSPEFALIGTLVALLVVPLFAGRGRYISAAIALLGALAALLLTGAVRPQVAGAGTGVLSTDAGAPMLIADNFAIFFKLFLMLFLALVTGLWLIGSVQRGGGEHANAPEFFVLLITSALGMALMVGTLNLLVILIAIEMASLPSYAIVAVDKRSRLGAEASIKYVLFGAGTASVMVYGASLLYGAFGTLDIPTIATRLEAGGAGVVAMLGLFGLLVGIGFKISAVPFHFWCPDVFEGAPIEVTTWLSVASKAAGLGLLLRIVYALGGTPTLAVSLAPLAMGIGVIASITCTVGNLAALRQDSVKRMLAYSSIAHAGYMMMAAAIFLQPGDTPWMNVGLAAVIAYVFVYLMMNLGAFGVTAMVVWRTGSDRMAEFTGLGRRAPWLALPMAVCLFSLVGLPPLGGFAAKWWLLIALGRAASMQPWLWALVLVAVINTAVSLYYYARVIRQMYLVDDAARPPLAAPAAGVTMVNLCAVMLLLLGTLLVGTLGEQSNTYASNLFGSRPAAQRTADSGAAPGPGLPAVSRADTR